MTRTFKKGGRTQEADSNAEAVRLKFDGWREVREVKAKPPPPRTYLRRHVAVVGEQGPEVVNFAAGSPAPTAQEAP